jgi:hypothetical protein
MQYLEEIMWHQFVQIDHIRRLPLNEQVIQYNMYLEDLSARRMLAQLGAAGGNSPVEPQPEPPTITNYLVTENEDQLTTEDDNPIILEQ